jgi:polyhydroxyalkanoate synthase subunit PhaE
MANQAGANDWTKDWRAMQEQFTSAWTNAIAQAGGQSQTPPLAQGFEMWTKLFGGAQTGNDTLDRAVAGSKQFVAFMQSALERAAGKGADAGSWREAIEKSFGAFNTSHNPALEAIRRAVGEGSKGWEQLAAEFARGAEPLRQQLAAGLNLPAFGYARERQVQGQRLGQAWLDFTEQLERYNALMLKASQLGLERFESKLGEQSEPGRGVQSLRALYDLWIDAAEEGYAEVALSDEFRNVYGELVNAQMQVRQLVQKEVEQMAAQMGMPTRTEVNASHAKLADIRRRIARIEEALGLDSGAGAQTAHVREEPVEPLGPRASRAAQEHPPRTSAPRRKPASTTTDTDTGDAEPQSFAAQLKASRAKSAERGRKPSKSKRNGDR